MMCLQCKNCVIHAWALQSEVFLTIGRYTNLCTFTFLLLGLWQITTRKKSSGHTSTLQVQQHTHWRHGWHLDITMPWSLVDHFKYCWALASVTTNIISDTAAGHHHTVPDVILTVTVHSASLSSAAQTLCSSNNTQSKRCHKLMGVT